MSTESQQEGPDNSDQDSGSVALLLEPFEVRAEDVEKAAPAARAAVLKLKEVRVPGFRHGLHRTLRRVDLGSVEMEAAK